MMKYLRFYPLYSLKNKLGKLGKAITTRLLMQKRNENIFIFQEFGLSGKAGTCK